MTLARLLFRFYDVTGGRITLNGQDVRAVQQASVRAAIGIVADTVLFNDSIGYNIGYDARRVARRDRGRREAAQIHDFIISTPEGQGPRSANAG